MRLVRGFHLAARLAAQALAAARVPVSVPGGRVVSVRYGQESRNQVVDLMRPRREGPHPLVMFVHGGGWERGHRKSGGLVARLLLPMGYAVASVGYRLLAEGSVADAAGDIARAAALLHADAAKHDLEAGKVGLVGHSAGGHLIALLATDPAYAAAAGFDPALLAAVVTLDGLFDFTMEVGGALAARRRALFGADPAAWAALSPVRHVAGMAARPRFMLIYEDQMPLYAPQAEGFARALRARGLAAETVVARGLTHPQTLGRFADTAAPMGRATLECLEATLTVPRRMGLRG